MRAMMSDPTLSELRREWKRAAGNHGAAAEVIAQREARAILAETEPTIDGISRSTIDRAWIPPAGTWSAERALAEALAAFVEGA